MNDTGLAKAIERQRGEWQAVSGDSFTVEETTWETVAPGAASEEPVEADILVFASRRLGELCEAGMLRPVRESILSGAEYDVADTFPTVRERLLRYGGQTMALPLGVRVPLLCYRPDLLETPPIDWADYGARARALADRQLPAAEPLEHHGAYVLLARAAPLAVHMHHEAVLFELETMRAQITSPPFVKAMEDLAILHRDAQLAEGSWERVRDGQSGMAIDFGPDDEAMLASPQSTNVSSPTAIRWAKLPGSSEVFNPSLGQWETLPRGVRQVPLLGIGGRLAGVTRSSRNAAGAFRLLAWLSSADVGGQIGPASDANMPYRASQLATSDEWFGAMASSTEGAHLGQLVESTLSRDACLVVPRIPGIDQYLAALQEAVDSVVRQLATPQEALERAAQRWEEITDRLGRDKQRRAYRRHLNLAN